MFATSAASGAVWPWIAYSSQRHLLPFTAFLAIDVFLAGLFAFAWIIHDRRERNLPRSRWFNIALVSAMFVVVPIHLWRTRPAGKRRVLALLGAFGIVIGTSVVSITGSIVSLIARALLTNGGQ
jgi:peptidoglycan/LPS O-acetylase OafA/YrhL